jgi:nifR3 family TIM-barrel protein
MHSNHNIIKKIFSDSPIILAPMAGITNLPFRRIMKDFGAALVYTEMISANGLIRAGKKTRQLMDSHPDEAPLGIQLFGDDPQVLAQAAASIADEAFLIDINMGCPVKKVVGSGAGSALLKEPQKIGRILSALRGVFQGPLTIKIRSGWDASSINFIEIGKIAEKEGVDAITLHPRTRAQGFSGAAAWEQIAELKEKINIPVFGSGDIFCAEDSVRMLNMTNCDAIMIGRGSYGNPWLLRQILELLRGQPQSTATAAEKLAVSMRHLELYRDQFGERKTLLEMRKHLCWYARGLSGASLFRVQLQQQNDLGDTLELTRNFFASTEDA